MFNSVKLILFKYLHSYVFGRRCVYSNTTAMFLSCTFAQIIDTWPVIRHATASSAREGKMSVMEMSEGKMSGETVLYPF